MIDKAAIIGGGVIGAGWAARLAVNNITPLIYDADAKASLRVAKVLDNANVAYAKLTNAPRPTMLSPIFCASVADAVAEAELIIEAVPERVDIKQKIYAEIENAADKQAIIASSTSGIRPTVLQERMQNPERLLAAHPFNPVYLLPLVELVGGEQTSSDTIDRAAAMYKNLGMHPLRVKKEIDAFIADRLLEAVWREALWLIKDGVATTTDIDDAIRMGFGLRWAQMGLFETYRIAGGEAGMRHFLAQFGPCLKWPWTKLMDVPELTDELIQTIADQSDAQSGKYSIRELERIRDDNLVAFMQSLKATQWGAGESLAAWETKLRKQASLSCDITQPIQTLSQRAPAHWADYNGHMNESRYLECFSGATDGLMRIIGADESYIAKGNSYFTAQTHICHLNEVSVNDKLRAITYVLLAEGKKLQLFHQLLNDNDDIVATGEHLLIHVNLQTRRSSLPLPEVQEAAEKIAVAHAKLPMPEGAGKVLSIN